MSRVHPRWLRTGRSGGYSLAGLLVALVIGMMVAAALFSIFVSLKTSFRTQMALARAMATEQRAVARLDHAVQMAGYFPAGEYQGPGRPQFAGGGAWRQGQDLRGTDAADAAGDTFSVRFRASRDDGLRDCGGGLVPGQAPATFMQTIAVRQGALVCDLADAAGAALATYTIADGVTRFALRYGVDGDGDGSVDRYLPAAGVTASEAWGRVLTVRFAVEMVNDSAVHDNGSARMAQAWTHTARMMHRD